MSAIGRDGREVTLILTILALLLTPATLHLKNLLHRSFPATLLFRYPTSRLPLLPPLSSSLPFNPFTFLIQRRENQDKHLLEIRPRIQKARTLPRPQLQLEYQNQREIESPCVH